ncbi:MULTISPECIES: diguanylate cyclase [unclassified Maridesulfovibrio]|uniref:diguanylate cyclase n=1 Tax=unclassified Maridesulfovibrio TaxID=2794999 RepID=UPI003B42B56D
MPTHTNGCEKIFTDFEKHFSSYLNQLPAIIWRIDIVENEISFLNSYIIPTDNQKVRSVLQNPQLARDMILSEDWEKFQNSLQQVRNRIPTSCVFRMRLNKNSTRWFRLGAIPDPLHQTCSVGMLMDISGQVDEILTTEGRPNLATKIDLIDDPVLFVRFSDRSVCAANNAAGALLKYERQELLSMNFQDLFRHNTDTDLHKLYEGLIFSDRWNGKLSVTDSMGKNHECSIRIQSISRNGENLLWITMDHRNDCQACKGIPVRGNETVPSGAAVKEMNKCSSIECLLETILQALPFGSPTDAIMLSRIFIDQNKVEVTAAGEPFAGLDENRTHPYEGSIAENIVRFNLKNHVVMETSKSIKPIDWALFIPHGIRSYYAQPFYENETLTNVLIFCSTKTHSYDPDAAPPLHELHDKFIETLGHCINK